MHEVPLTTVAEDRVEQEGQSDSERLVVRWSGELAERSGAATLDTVHVAFAARKVFGSSLDHALYRCGTTWEQLTEALVTPIEAEVAF